MANTYAERVNPDQAAALTLEELGLGMHFGVLSLFGDASEDDEAQLDVERLQDILERALPEVPHGRQRVRRIPLEGQWIWTDDERFNLHYHVRHSRLPRPGDERQLKRLVGRLMSERLDPNRPLWEAWVIEGVAGARFALLLKLHAGVLEGTALPELLDAIGRLDAASALPPVPEWKPHPVPATAELLVGSALHWSSKGRELLERARDGIAHPREAFQAGAAAPEAFREIVREVLGAAPRTVLNPRRTGGHRRVDLLQLDARECERVAQWLSAPIADVALAVLAGGLEAFLRERGDKPETGEIQTQVSLAPELRGVPASTTLRVPLPLGIADPVERVIEVGRARLAAETGPQAAVHDFLDRVEAWIPPSIRRAVQSAGPRSGTNLSVELRAAPERLPTLLGEDVRSVALLAPLHTDQGLSVGMVWTSDQLEFGFNSDWDLFPDLHELVLATERAFDQLRLRTQPAPRAASDTRKERPA